MIMACLRYGGTPSGKQPKAIGILGLEFQKLSGPRGVDSKTIKVVGVD